MHRILMPRSNEGTRWQIYPSDAEALSLALIMRDSSIDKELYMIRIMINYFLDNQKEKLDLINYAQTYSKPKYDQVAKSKRSVDIAQVTKENIVEQDIIEEAQRILKILHYLEAKKEIL